MKTFDYKKLTKEELDDIFRDFPFKLSPMRHQLISLSFASVHGRCGFLHGVGTGKTLAALWTTQLWENKKILVVCPSSAFSAWERDISKYTDYSHEFLLGSGRHRRSLLKKKRDIYITETDIKNILRTKAAIYAACYLLLQSLGYSFDDLENIFIAGGFGNYLDTKKSIMLGLLPDVPLEKFKFIGNGSLAGAYLTLISEENKAEAEAIFEKLTYIELSVSNKFYNEFVSALFLPHTNLALFPSVKEIL